MTAGIMARSTARPHRQVFVGIEITALSPSEWRPAGRDRWGHVVVHVVVPGVMSGWVHAACVSDNEPVPVTTIPSTNDLTERG